MGNMREKTNRRQFNSRALALLATSAAVHTFPAKAGQMTNDRLGVAVVGLNTRGKAHIEGFASDERIEIRAVVDVDPALTAAATDHVEALTGTRPKAYDDFRRALDRDDIHIISVATPNHWHAVMGIWAMQAGKDVYLEKPISHNIAEGRALCNAAERLGRILQSGTQCRSSTSVHSMIQAIDEGAIGEVSLARGLCYKRRKSIGALGSYPPPSEINYRLWCGPAPATDPELTRPEFHYDWHWQRHYGNGDSGNQGPHQTDVARWGLGIHRHPNVILSYGGRLGYQAERNDPNYVDAGDTANTQVSIYDYGDKTIVFETRGLECEGDIDQEIGELFGYKKGNKIGVIFYGSDGFALQGPDFFSTRLFDKNRKLIREFRHDQPTFAGLNASHMGNFVDAVIAGDASRLHANAECGHFSAAIAHLGNISYYLGEANRAHPEEIRSAVGSIASRDNDLDTLNRTLKHLEANRVDPQADRLSLGPLLSFDSRSEKFVHNDAANELLSRQYASDFQLPSL